MPPRPRNCHSGLVMIQQLIHKEIRCFIIVRKKSDIKNAVVFHYEAKIIIEMRKKNYWPARGGVYILRDFQGGHKKTKNWPATILFSRIYSSIDKLLSFQVKKKLLIFSLLCKGVQGKRRKNYYQSAVLLYWYAKTIMKLLKHIWIRSVNY